MDDIKISESERKAILEDYPKAFLETIKNEVDEFVHHVTALDCSKPQESVKKQALKILLEFVASEID